MRAKEFIREYKEYPTREYEGVTFTMKEKDGQLIVRPLNDYGISMGHVVFNMDGQILDPQDLVIANKYQGQGIARVMYDYIKSLGFTIERSWDQTDAGKGFWNKHRGEDVRVWEDKELSEAFNQPYSIRWSVGDHGDYDAYSQLDDGTVLEIMFSDQGDNSWMVDFFRDNSAEITGGGDAYKVLATVLTSIRQFIGLQNPNKINFTAEKNDDPKGNRARLYDRMIQRYIGNSGYTINRENHPGGATYNLIRNGQDLNEFATSDNGGGRKFIPWNEFIASVKEIVGKDFDVVENVVKSTIKARFVPHDPMEYGPTMLYSYYEARAGRNKGAVSTRGSIQVGKYIPNSSQLGTRNFITSFNLLKGHKFERHFDLTFDNIYEIANIIKGNTEGAYQMQPQGVAEGSLNEFAPGGNFKPPVTPRKPGDGPWGDDDRSKLLQTVRQLLLAGNKIDWKVVGQMGHVVRVNDHSVILKRWGKPHSKINYSLMLDDSDDENYIIRPIGPKHYKVVSSDTEWQL
jgi:hypothetical protein